METHAKAATLPADVISAFTSSAVTALQELLQLEAIANEAPPTTQTWPADAILAVVTLQRPVPGMLRLVVSVESAKFLAERYLPAGTELTDEIIYDVAGEFANVIAGQAKSALKGTPYHFTLSIPVVSRGGLSNAPGDVASATIVSIVFESGSMWLMLDLPSCPGA